jgi:hypothetical protein
VVIPEYRVLHMEQHFLMYCIEVSSKWLRKCKL